MADDGLSATDLRNIVKVCDDVWNAVQDGDVDITDGAVRHLTYNLVAMAMPNTDIPEELDMFSYLVGAVLGAVTQRYADERK